MPLHGMLPKVSLYANHGLTLKLYKIAASGLFLTACGLIKVDTTTFFFDIPFLKQEGISFFRPVSAGRRVERDPCG